MRRKDFILKIPELDNFDQFVMVNHDDTIEGIVPADIMNVVVTDEPLEKDKHHLLPDEAGYTTEDLYDLAARKPKKAIPILEKIVQEYPHILAYI